MKLLLDIGNTRIKAATVVNGQLLVLDPITLGASDLHKQLQQTLAPILDQLQGCVVSSVASEQVNQAVEHAVAPLDVHWARSQAAAAGVLNAYPDHQQLGVDRWVSMLGLAHHFREPHPPIVLASFGTATTVDTLSPENRFEGGLILPGASMMREALARGTARLPQTSGRLEDFPTSTISAITSGIAAAQVGAITRQVMLTAHRFQQTPVLCVSGGARETFLAPLTTALPDVQIVERPHAVLDGLCALACLPN